MKDTVVIMGSHPRTREEFDFKRQDCDLWVFNEAVSNGTFPKADAVFQMHEEAIWRNPANRNDPKHSSWLKSQTQTPVYMQDKYEDVPSSIKYPLEEISNLYNIKYFTSSVAYAIALACFKSYKRIEIYGADLETGTEYQYQRDGVTLWIGVAIGLGIEVDAHVSFFDQPLYGYDGRVTIEYSRFEDRISELVPMIEDAKNEYMAKHRDLQELIKDFGASSSAALEDNLYKAVMEIVAIGEKTGVLDGCRQENLRYKGKADTMKAETGDKFVFSRQEFESSAHALTKNMNAAALIFNGHGTELKHIHAGLSGAAKGSPKRRKLLNTYIRTMDAYLEASNQAATYKGAAEENYRYMSWLDKHIRAAGGSKSEAVLLEGMK